MEGWKSESTQEIIKYADENPIVYKYDWGTYVGNKVEDHVDHLLDMWLEKKLKGVKR